MILKIFIIGIAILVTAIVLNIIAKLLNVSTWYDFIQNKTINNPLEIIWLFVIYPFVLGLVAYIMNKVLS